MKPKAYRRQKDSRKKCLTFPVRLNSMRSGQVSLGLVAFQPYPLARCQSKHVCPGELAGKIEFLFQSGAVTLPRISGNEGLFCLLVLACLMGARGSAWKDTQHFERQRRHGPENLALLGERRSFKYLCDGLLHSYDAKDRWTYHFLQSLSSETSASILETGQSERFLLSYCCAGTSPALSADFSTGDRRQHHSRKTVLGVTAGEKVGVSHGV